MDPLLVRLKQLSPCDLADALTADQFVDPNIQSLWGPAPKLVGRAFTIECPAGDHLMFHAAVYKAKPGDVLVAKGDSRYALAGGNVCAIAQQNGIAGCVIDGMIRDLAEVREMQFPVFARGVFPKPGAKKQLGTLNQPVECGGVRVENGDFILATEEGIGIIPAAMIETVLDKAESRASKDASTPLPQWRESHYKTVTTALEKLGFE